MGLTKFQRFKATLGRGGKAVAKGYGSTVRFTQKYAPKAERVFGGVAKDVTESFKPQPTERGVMEKTLGYKKPKERLEIDFSTPRPKKIMKKSRGYVQLPIKKRRTHDFGSLTFDM